MSVDKEYFIAYCPRASKPGLRLKANVLCAAVYSPSPVLQHEHVMSSPFLCKYESRTRKKNPASCPVGDRLSTHLSDDKNLDCASEETNIWSSHNDRSLAIMKQVGLQSEQELSRPEANVGSECFTPGAQKISPWRSMFRGIDEIFRRNAWYGVQHNTRMLMPRHCC